MQSVKGQYFHSSRFADIITELLLKTVHYTPTQKTNNYLNTLICVKD
jgi:hypothetical protein